MKVNINFIYSFLLIIIIALVAVGYHNNNVLESRINSLNKNGSDFNSEKTFKEDYYITQQSHDTNLILVVFTVLIAFTGLFTYVNVVERYNSKMSEVKNEVEKYKSEYNAYHKKFIKLELDLYFQIAIYYANYANNYKNENDIKNYIILSMCSMEKYAQVLKLSEDELYKQRILNILNSSIDNDFLLIKENSEQFVVSDLDLEVFKNRTTTISEVLDNDNLFMFNVILSKIKIV